MEKSYYAYCRPKLPNHPWSLERIPFGRCILSTSKQSVDIKGNKSILFDNKYIDEIGVTTSNDGSIILPIGKYVIELTSLIETPVACNVEIQLGDRKIFIPTEASTTSTIFSKSLIEITEEGKSLKVTNNIKDTIKLSDLILSISKF